MRIPLEVDANGYAIQDSLGQVAEKEITFTATGDGAVGAVSLFTVTGMVRVRLFAEVITAVAGSGTIEVGTAGLTTGLIPLTTGTELDEHDIWFDASPTTVIEALSSMVEYVISNGQDIIQTIRTATLTAGKIRYIARWFPVSANGNVVAA